MGILKASIFVLLVFSGLKVYSTPITVKNLSKKWHIDKYSYLIFSEEPGKKEVNDYIAFKEDMSFESVSEGRYDKGKWRLDTAKKRIFLAGEIEKGELIFMIHKLDNNQLILIIDDPSEPGLEDIKIYFKS